MFRNVDLENVRGVKVSGGKVRESRMRLSLFVSDN